MLVPDQSQAQLLDGPHHVLLLRLQHPDTQEGVKPYVQSSARYGHSDMVLQTMLTSSENTERSFAITKIFGTANTKEMLE